MKKLIQRIALAGILALAAIGSYKLGNERGHKAGFLEGKTAAYKGIDNLAKITTERLLLDDTRIDQNSLDIAGKRIINSSGFYMSPSYDYLGITCELSDQARKREEANDLSTRDFLISNANQLSDYYAALEEIRYNRVANWLRADDSNAKRTRKNPINWQFSK